MPLRNPFRRAPDSPTTTTTTPPGPLTLPVTTEYKLSEIHPNGTFLPPSPPAKDTHRFFTTRSTTSTSSGSSSSADDNNPFTISRESFDSYRRSFDISARSPVVDERPRHSVDVARLRLPAAREVKAERVEEFEEVGLGDEAGKTRRQGIFARWGKDDGAETGPGRFAGRELFGRRRTGTTGVGEELGVMEEREREREGS